MSCVQVSAGRHGSPAALWRVPRRGERPARDGAVQGAVQAACSRAQRHRARAATMRPPAAAAARHWRPRGPDATRDDVRPVGRGGSGGAGGRSGQGGLGRGGAPARRGADRRRGRRAAAAARGRRACRGAGGGAAAARDSRWPWRAGGAGVLVAAALSRRRRGRRSASWRASRDVGHCGVAARARQRWPRSCTRLAAARAGAPTAPPRMRCPMYLFCD